MRWTEDQYQAWLHRELGDVGISEKALQSAVARLARQYNYLYYHTFDSRRSPSGFVDCVLAKPGHPVLCLELKTATGHVTLPQQAWLGALAQCTGVVAQVVRPADLDDLVVLLRGA